MKIRKYQSTDYPVLAKLFYDTVHTVNKKDYSQTQLHAWATSSIDTSFWDKSFLEHNTLVAEKDGIVVGFGDMDKDGYLDRLYVHKDYQKRGIATAICDKLEKQAKANRIIVHASITAKVF